MTNTLWKSDTNNKRGLSTRITGVYSANKMPLTYFQNNYNPPSVNNRHRKIRWISKNPYRPKRTTTLELVNSKKGNDCPGEWPKAGTDSIFPTIFRAHIDAQKRYTRYTKTRLAWLARLACHLPQPAKNIGKTALLKSVGIRPAPPCGEKP